MTQESKTKYKPADYEDSILFATDYEEIKDKPTTQAMQALIYEDSTPDGLAKHFKEQGNDLLKRLNAKRYYKDAEICYTKGLEQPMTDMVLKQELLTNRAHVNILLGNYRKAVEDCEECLKIEPKNEKAYYRGAKACISSKRWEKAIEFCEAALKLKSSKAIRLLKEEAEKGLKRQKEIEAEKLEYERRKKEIPKQIMKMLQSRGIKIGKSELKTELSNFDTQFESTLNPGGLQIDPKTQEIYFPVVICYDDYSQTDFIQAFSENHTFRDQLELMFPPLGPEFPFGGEQGRKNYVLDNIRIFYLDQKSMNKIEDRMVEVKLDDTLGEVLRKKDYYLPRELKPVFHVVCNQSDYCKKWLKK